MAYGTAPHKSGGVWYSSTGHRLTPAGQKYWEMHYQQGAVTADGHVNAKQHVLGHQVDTARYGKTRQSRLAAGRAVGENARRVQEKKQFGESLAESLNPAEAIGAVASGIKHKDPLEAGLGAAAILPVGKLIKPVAEGVKAVKAVGLGTRAAAKEAKATHYGGALGKKLHDTMGDAIKATGEQKGVYRKEKGLRFQHVDSEFEKAGGGAEGSRAARAAMGGEHTKVPWHGMKDFTQREVDDLHDLVYKHPKLDHGERLDLWDALDRGTAGHALQHGQIKLIEKAFGPVAAKHARAGQMGHLMAQLVNVPRSLMSTLDASFGMRQALPLAASHPKLWAKEYGGSFKYFGGKGGARRYNRDMTSIEKDPTFPMWKEAGMPFTDIGRKISHREEAFPSPIAEKLTGGDRSPIRMSSRAYTGAANRLRITYANHLLQKAEKQGYKNTVKLREDIVRLVGAHTGRGHLPGSLEKAGPALNTVFFSPRLFASRIDTVALAAKRDLHPFVKREARGSVAKIAGGVGAVTTGAAIAGAKVETDPRNADFGKIKLGNTRVDPWAGFQQPVRAASQIASGKIISSTTGKTLRLEGGNSPSPLERFVESKLSPQAGIVMDVARRKTFMGEPLTLKGEAKSHLVPLGPQDANEVRKDTHSWAKAAGALGLSSVGIGVQNYSAKNKKKTHHHSAVQPRDEHGRFARAKGRSYAHASSGKSWATGSHGEDHPAPSTHYGGRRFARGG